MDHLTQEPKLKDMSVSIGRKPIVASVTSVGRVKLKNIKLKDPLPFPTKEEIYEAAKAMYPDEGTTRSDKLRIHLARLKWWIWSLSASTMKEDNFLTHHLYSRVISLYEENVSLKRQLYNITRDRL